MCEKTELFAETPWWRRAGHYFMTFRPVLFCVAVLVGMLLAFGVYLVAYAICVHIIPMLSAEMQTWLTEGVEWQKFVLKTATTVFLGTTAVIYGFASVLQSNRWSYLDSIVKYWHQLLHEAGKSYSWLLSDSGDGEKIWNGLADHEKAQYAVHNQRCVDCMSMILDYVQKLPPAESKRLEQAWRFNFRAYIDCPLPVFLWKTDKFGVRSSVETDFQSFMEKLNPALVRS